MPPPSERRDSRERTSDIERLRARGCTPPKESKARKRKTEPHPNERYAGQRKGERTAVGEYHHNHPEQR